MPNLQNGRRKYKTPKKKRRPRQHFSPKWHLQTSLQFCRKRVKIHQIYWVVKISKTTPIWANKLPMNLRSIKSSRTRARKCSFKSKLSCKIWRGLGSHLCLSVVWAISNRMKQIYRARLKTLSWSITRYRVKNSETWRFETFLLQPGMEIDTTSTKKERVDLKLLKEAIRT